MSLINCPECGHQVSDHAKTCPNCGIDIAGNPMIQHQTSETPVNTTGKTPASATETPTPVHGEQKKKTGGKWKIMVAAFIIAIAIVGAVGYLNHAADKKNELDAYENAMGSREPSVLQNFLDIYTDAPQAHRDSIEAHLAALQTIDTEWTNAVVSNSKTALERYIKLHPGSIHIPEAKIKIDSIDWVAATTANTPEAYQAYINAHYDGLHYDEARAAYDKADAGQVSDEDREMVSTLCSHFFRSLAQKDEESLTMTLANVMTDFLHRPNATKSDVISYMNKLHSPTDITGMTFRSNNDWKINKAETPEGEYEYSVTFSVDQKIERTDETKETFCTYKVEAKISPDHKISSLNMKKIVQ